MGFKGLEFVRKILHQVASDALKHRHPGDAEFVAAARRSQSIRDGYVFGFDGATIIDKHVRPGDDVTSLSGTYVALRVRKDIEAVVQQPGCGGCVFVMDLPDHKTRAKLIEYLRSRYTEEKPDECDPDKGMIIRDSYFPAGKKWVTFKLNPKLRRQANSYLFRALTEAEYQPWAVKELEQHAATCDAQRIMEDQAASAGDGSGGGEVRYTSEFSASDEYSRYASAQFAAMLMQDEEREAEASPSSGRTPVQRTAGRNAGGASDVLRALTSSAAGRKTVSSKFIVIDGGLDESQVYSDDRVMYMAKRLDYDAVYAGGSGGKVNVLPRKPYYTTTSRIGEGEMSVLYQLDVHASDRDVVVLTCDSDIVFIALLAARDRIDAETGAFRNKVFVKMSGGSESKTPEEGGGGKFVYVDINRLYESVVKFFAKKAPRVAHPVETFCWLMMLNGTDFTVDTYCSGVSLPKIFDFYLDNAADYADIVRRYDGVELPLAPQAREPAAAPAPAAALGRARGTVRLRVVEVDEGIFTRFSQALYVHHFGKACNNKARKEKVDLSALRWPIGTPQVVRDYDCVRAVQVMTLVSERSASRIPPPATMFPVYARTFSYLFLYWCNTHSLRLQNADVDVSFDCAATDERGTSLWGYVDRGVDPESRRSLLEFATSVSREFPFRALIASQSQSATKLATAPAAHDPSAFDEFDADMESVAAMAAVAAHNTSAFDEFDADMESVAAMAAAGARPPPMPQPVQLTHKPKVSLRKMLNL
jgi:hypothetical protein